MHVAQSFMWRSSINLWTGSPGGAEAYGGECKDWDMEEEVWKIARGTLNSELCLVSGSLAFVHRLLNAGADPTRMVISLQCGTDGKVRGLPKTGLSWCRLQHHCVGGATNIKSWIGYGQNLSVEQSSLFPDQVKRRMRDLLNPTAMGKRLTVEDMDLDDLKTAEYAHPERYKTAGLHPGGLWPAHRPGSYIIAPSVFSKTGWVKRQPTDQELAQFWDVPVGIVPKVNSLGIKKTGILTEAPGKILWESLSRLKLFELKEDLVEEEKTKAMIPTFGLVPMSEESTTSGFAKATKSDDAEVPVYIWNHYVMLAWNLERNRQGEPEIEPGPAEEREFDRLRKVMLRWWRRNLTRSFISYLKLEYGPDWQHLDSKELKLDLETGRDAIHRACGASFFEWEDGSTLFFWRWHPEFRKSARDGVPWRIKGALPKFMRRQKKERDKTIKLKVAKKLGKVKHRRYIEKGYVKSLTSYFAVPKGTDDIRMVYDATASGLNESCWTPKFGMYTVNSVLDSVDFGTYMGDRDLGEMFLNFPIDRAIRPYVGIDLGPYWSDMARDGDDSEPPQLIHRWSRNMMGAKPSPYNSIQSSLWVEDVIRGDHTDGRNALRWDGVMLNLPGFADYDPSLPWVYKYIVRPDGSKDIAPDYKGFVDDLRPSGPSDLECWRSMSRIGKLFQYHGIQDAARKVRPPTQRPGAWAGAIVRVLPEGIGVAIGEDKWSKFRRIVGKWSERLKQERERIRVDEDSWKEDNTFVEKWKERCKGGDVRIKVSHKEMEKDRGFLVHVARTYPSTRPYLKGFHLTLDSWRDHRDKEGWKENKKEILCEDDDSMSVESLGSEDEESSWASEGSDGGVGGVNLKAGLNRGSRAGWEPPPKSVKTVPRFQYDLDALLAFATHDYAPTRIVRPRGQIRVCYGFGDASGSGLGSSFKLKSGLRIRFGVWGSDEDDKSSNFRELRNLVEALEDLWVQGELVGVEVFIFTDNSTAERAFYKGSSSSRLLFELILRLHELEMKAGAKIHIVHCSGTRMIDQGSDGLSRGDMNEGVMEGEDMLSFVPTHLGAFERSPDLLEWVRSWCLDEECEPLSVDEWYTKGQDIEGGEVNREEIWMPTYGTGVRLWAPPPAAALTAVEEMRRARHKRQKSTHIVVCPRLMTYLWLRPLLKEADLCFEIPPGAAGFWPRESYEPLFVFVCFPFIREDPWKLKGCPRLLAVERKLRKLFQDGEGDGRSILRQLLKLSGQLATMSPKLVRQVLFYKE